jgi:hypothetical protein
MGLPCTVKQYDSGTGGQDEVIDFRIGLVPNHNIRFWWCYTSNTNQSLPEFRKTRIWRWAAQNLGCPPGPGGQLVFRGLACVRHDVIWLSVPKFVFWYSANPVDTGPKSRPKYHGCDGSQHTAHSTQQSMYDYWNLTAITREEDIRCLGTTLVVL